MLNTINMNILILLFTLAANIGYSQANQAYSYFQLIPGESFSQKFYSEIEPQIPNYDGFDANLQDGNLGFEIGTNLNEWNLSFKVADDYTGYSKLIVQYFEQLNGIVVERYSIIEFEVVESYIKTKQDYLSVQKNAGFTTINVLANDVSSNGGLFVESIINSEHLSSTIFMGDITVKPDIDFTGMAYCQFIVSNSNGVKEVETLSVMVTDSETPIDSLSFITINTKSLTVVLSDENYAINTDKSTSIGAINFVHPNVIEYTPSNTFLGNDVINLVNNAGEEFVVNILVKEDPHFLTSLQKDIVFTAVEQTVIFNVLENDFKPNNTVVAYDDALVYLGDGVFSYTPPSGYVGVRGFKYSTSDAIIEEEGDIVIYINNFYPEAKEHYSFVTKKGIPVVLNYDIPLDDFSYQVTTAPSNGRIVIPDNNTYDHRCGLVQAKGMLVYEPQVNFYGMDAFDIQYCIAGYCRNIKIEVEVRKDKTRCECIGPDCVWTGDVDQNGKVNVKDILPLGYYFGESGEARIYANPEDWIGQASEDWVLKQGNGKNLKFIDTNGDGFIDVHDMDGIAANYDQYHNLVPDQVFEQRQYPLEIIASEHSVNKGDWLSIDIIFGNEEYPVLDVHGIAYTLQIASGAIDSSTAQIVHHSESWIGYNSPTLEFGRQVSDGRFDLGISRTTGHSVSGKGLTHTLGFIAEEDIEGLKSDKKLDFIEVPVYLRNIVLFDGAGESYSLPDAYTSFTLELGDKSKEIIENGQHIKIFPNPSQDQFSIYLNANDKLQHTSFYDASGQLLESREYDELNRYSYDVHNFPSGLYFLQVTSSSGTFMKKIFIGGQQK